MLLIVFKNRENFRCGDRIEIGRCSLYFSNVCSPVEATISMVSRYQPSVIGNRIVQISDKYCCEPVMRYVLGSIMQPKLCPLEVRRIDLR